MDYKVFLEYTDKELEYLRPFDLSYEDELLKTAGALMVLREYLEDRLKET